MQQQSHSHRERERDKCSSNNNMSFWRGMTATSSSSAAAVYLTQERPSPHSLFCIQVHLRKFCSNWSQPCFRATLQTRTQQPRTHFEGLKLGLTLSQTLKSLDFLCSPLMWLGPGVDSWCPLGLKQSVQNSQRTWEEEKEENISSVSAADAFF